MTEKDKLWLDILLDFNSIMFITNDLNTIVVGKTKVWVYH